MRSTSYVDLQFRSSFNVCLVLKLKSTRQTFSLLFVWKYQPHSRKYLEASAKYSIIDFQTEKKVRKERPRQKVHARSDREAAREPQDMVGMVKIIYSFFFQWHGWGSARIRVCACVWERRVRVCVCERHVCEERVYVRGCVWERGVRVCVCERGVCEREGCVCACVRGVCVREGCVRACVWGVCVRERGACEACFWEGCLL